MPTPSGSAVIEHGGFYANADTECALSSNVATLDEDGSNLTAFGSRYVTVSTSNGRLTLGKGRWLLSACLHLEDGTDTLSIQFAKNGTAIGTAGPAYACVAGGSVYQKSEIVIDVENGDYFTCLINNVSTATGNVTVGPGSYFIATALETFSSSRQGK